MKPFLLFLAFSLLLFGCAAPAPSDVSPSVGVSIPAVASATAIASASATPSDYPSVYPAATATQAPNLPYDAPPRISGTTARPSNPDRNQPFYVDVTAEDDVGVWSIVWSSTDAFSLQPEPASFLCGLNKTCSTTFMFKASSEGTKTVTVVAVDSAGRESSPSSLAFTVRPFDYKEPTATPAPEATLEPTVQAAAACGNGVCDAGEGYETCAGDCPYAGFSCGNGVCEGGESYESCSQDCSLDDILGTSCGDDACQPGEDADYCPADCAVENIRPNCGNAVCDAWESQDSCYEDCANVQADAESCVYDSECGYHKACQGGKCVTVDCTNDAQCPSGKRCSGNSCVYCPMGPYGRSC